LPDVYEGAPTVVTAFFAIVPKLAIMVVLSRLFGLVFYDLASSRSTLVMLCSLASMIVAAFAALSQRRLKRFFAYSSIGHVGYMLMGFAAGSIEGLQGIFIYLFIYAVTSVFVWTFILALEEEKNGRALYFTDLVGLGTTNPLLAGGFMFAMFSMAGVPPLAGFFAKMFLFFSALDGGLFRLAIVGVLTSCLGAFYYIRFIKIMYFETPKVWFVYKPISALKGLMLAISRIIILFFILDPQLLVTSSRLRALTICTS